MTNYFLFAITHLWNVNFVLKDANIADVKSFIKPAPCLFAILRIFVEKNYLQVKKKIVCCGKVYDTNITITEIFQEQLYSWNVLFYCNVQNILNHFMEEVLRE